MCEAALSTQHLNNQLIVCFACYVDHVNYDHVCISGLSVYYIYYYMMYFFHSSCKSLPSVSKNNNTMTISGIVKYKGWVAYDLDRNYSCS